MDKKPVYSPSQCTFGAFLGGPLATIWCMHWNFRALGKYDSARKTNLYGAVAMLALFAVLPFLPEKFPNIAIPIVTMVTTRSLVNGYQFSKEAIAESETLTFRSNWRTLGVGLSSMVITLLALAAYMMVLGGLGIIHLA